MFRPLCNEESLYRTFLEVLTRNSEEKGVFEEYCFGILGVLLNLGMESLIFANGMLRMATGVGRREGGRREQGAGREEEGEGREEGGRRRDGGAEIERICREFGEREDVNELEGERSLDSISSNAKSIDISEEEEEEGREEGGEEGQAESFEESPRRVSSFERPNLKNTNLSKITETILEESGGGIDSKKEKREADDLLNIFNVKSAQKKTKKKITNISEVYRPVERKVKNRSYAVGSKLAGKDHILRILGRDRVQKTSMIYRQLLIFFNNSELRGEGEGGYTCLPNVPKIMREVGRICALIMQKGNKELKNCENYLNFGYCFSI